MKVHSVFFIRSGCNEYGMAGRKLGLFWRNKLCGLSLIKAIVLIMVMQIMVNICSGKKALSWFLFVLLFLRRSECLPTLPYSVFTSWKKKSPLLKYSWKWDLMRFTGQDEALGLHSSHWSLYRSWTALNAALDSSPLRCGECGLGCQWVLTTWSIFSKANLWVADESTKEVDAAPAVASGNFSCMIWHWLFISCHQQLLASILNEEGKAPWSKTKGTKWQNATAN